MQTKDSDSAEDHEKDSLSRYISPLYQLALALVIAAGLIIVVFCLFGLIERFWLVSQDPGHLRLFYLIRGVTTALAVGFTVGWVIIRTSPALLTATATKDAPTPGEENEARLLLYTLWFISMRWIALLVAAILVFLEFTALHLLSTESRWPLAGLVTALALCNVFYTLRIRRPARARSLLVWQAYVDLLILTLLLYFAGGVENPLAVFMLFHVIIGGILLSKKECYRMATAGSLLFVALAICAWADTLPHFPLEIFPAHLSIQSSTFLPYTVSVVIVHSAVLFLTAYFVTNLSERLGRNERRLAALAERALADGALLEQALETTSAGLRVLSPELVPVWANARWQKWFGECSSTCHIFPEYPNAGCPAEQCLIKGELDVFEMERPVEGASPTDDATQVFQITSAPVFDSRGSVIRVVQLAQDITAQKEAHARMMRAGQMAAVGELAGQIAHEVNNPIAIMSAKGNLLLKNQRGEMSDKVASEISKIVEHSNRVARIAQGLLSYSRPSPTSRTQIDIRQPIRKSIAMIEGQAKDHRIEIEDSLPTHPVEVFANASEMEQVFLNLFINAVQAMPDGGRLSLSLFNDTADEDKPMLAIAVDDTGSGISPDLRQRIFEPFFTTKEESHGTGLGLSICHGLLRGHSGEIIVGESPAGGSRFLVKLPLKGPQADFVI